MNAVMPTILKLGGSVITNKKIPLTANLSAIERLASEISNAAVPSLILVHGGGSFGHPIAQQYGIQKGYVASSQLVGFAKTHQAMIQLNTIIVNSLIACNVPAVPVHPSSCIITKNGRIQWIEKNPLTKMLKLKFVPVLHGDAVLDSEKGFTILSGDQLVSFLARKFTADRIIIGVDVNGLYTSNPQKNSSARLLRYVTLEELNNIQHKIDGSNVTDVTGGMLGKTRELALAVKQGIKTILVNALQPNRIQLALKNERVIGTIIVNGENNGGSNRGKKN